MYKREKEVYEYLLDNEESAIKALERHYIAALDDVRLCIRMMQADEQTQSVIHRINYQKKLEKQLEGIVEKLHMAEYKTIKQYLESSYTDAFVGTMYTLHGQDVPIIAPIDQNAAIKAIQLDTKLTDRKIHASATGELVTLYESLGVDADKLKKVARSEITRGIASGMLYDDIARNVSNTTKAPLSRAKTIVRTEGHRIQQQSAEDARQAAKARGADVVKQWDSTLDGDTRPTHRELDGQIKETNEPFVLGTKKAMHPGDFGDPAEDCNCRCVALTRARKALDAAELATMKERAEFFGLAEDEDKKQTFAEFEKKYLKAAEHVRAEETNGRPITKSIKYAVNPNVINSRGYADKFGSMASDKDERREYLRAAKEILHHRSGQNGEDLYLYNSSTRKWTKSTTGKNAGTPDYTDEIKAAITKAKKGELVAFHNHPESYPPSVDDLNASLSNGYSVGYILCHDGKVYRYTPPKSRIDESFYNIRVANYIDKGYNMGDAQMATIKHLSSLYGFVFEEVK